MPEHDGHRGGAGHVRHLPDRASNRCQPLLAEQKKEIAEGEGGGAVCDEYVQPLCN